VSARPAYNVSVVADPARQMAAPGSTARLYLQLRNTGLQTDSFALSLAGNLWPSRLYTETAAVELSAPIVVPPCAERRLRLEVDVPVTAATGAQDQVTVAASGRSSASTAVTTIAFPTWQFETSMPTPRYRLAAASLPGQPFYYALGGLGGETYDVAQDANERYNACNRQWERLAPLPTPRGNIGAAALGGKIYVPGGYDGFTALDVLEIYDPVSDSWSSGAPLPKPLGGAAAAAHGGKLYLFGGLDADGSFTDATFAYDPAADSWTRAPARRGAGVWLPPNWVTRSVGR
jgi:hypothetical protein